MQALMFDVPVAELAMLVNPMGGWLWGCDPISAQEVVDAIAATAFEARPWDGVKDEIRGTPQARDFHVQRIAYLVKHGYTTNDRGIVLDISGQPDGRSIGIQNGNHRIAAAIIRRDESIRVLAYVEDATDLTALAPGAVPVPPTVKA